MVRGTIELQGETAIIAKLEGLDLALKHNKRLMGIIGNYIKLQTLKRVSRGVDADGVPMVEYSKLYAAKRKKAGLPTGKVDLFWTGSMTASLTYVPLDGVVRLYFMDTTDKFGMRNPKKAYFIQTHKKKPRHFFAISMKDITAIERVVNDYVDRYLRKVVISGSK